MDQSGHLVEEEPAALLIEQSADAELAQLYRQIGAKIARSLLRSGLVLVTCPPKTAHEQV